MRYARSLDKLDRRSFLKAGALGAAAAVGLPALARGAEESETAPVYRTLGRTGLKVSVVGIGAMRTTEPAILQAAFDRGVNYLDTAHCYMGGRNEKIVGKALKGYRDKVYVATKCHIGPRDAMLKSVEDSLRSLQTDYVDVIQLHGLGSKEEVMHEGAREALAEMVKQGKARFVGYTTHSNEADLLNATADDPDKFFDMVLVAYNFQKPPELKAAIARAANAKVGVVGMKTQAGGYDTKELGDISPHQAALKWVLQDTNVHTTIPSMVDLSQVEEDTQVMQSLKMTATEARVLDAYGTAIAGYHCRACGHCEGDCPNGVDIRTVNRCLMYAEGYRDMPLAQEAYAALPSVRSASACADCAECTARCAFGINIAERMGKAATLFA